MILVLRDRVSLFNNSKFIWEDSFFMSESLVGVDNFSTHTHIISCRARVAKNNYFTKYIKLNFEVLQPKFIYAPTRGLRLLLEFSLLHPFINQIIKFIL